MERRNNIQNYYEIIKRELKKNGVELPEFFFSYRELKKKRFKYYTFKLAFRIASI